VTPPSIEAEASSNAAVAGGHHAEAGHVFPGHPVGPVERVQRRHDGGVGGRGTALEAGGHLHVALGADDGAADLGVAVGVEHVLDAGLDEPRIRLGRVVDLADDRLLVPVDFVVREQVDRRVGVLVDGERRPAVGGERVQHCPGRWGRSLPLHRVTVAHDRIYLWRSPDRRRNAAFLPVRGESPPMSARNDVAPETLSVDLTEDGVVVEYKDGREVFYRGVPERVEERVVAAPAKDVHVLVTDPNETEGVLLYVNDLNTHDDILEDTGVGRIMLETGEEEEVFPGVTISDTSMRVAVEADPETARGRVFVFVEDEMGERSYEIVGSE
jgi:hypothetical protein